MKRTLNLAIAAVIIVALIGYMVTFTVRFNETAIVTTFGRVGDESVYNPPRDDGLPGEEAGLKFKWPWPIQQVARKYDTRLQVLEGVLAQQGTKDNQTIVLNTYLTWRISDPLAFYQRLGSPAEAVAALNLRVQGARSVIGNYTFDELTNSDPAKLKLDDAEDRMKEEIQAKLDELQLGIEVEDVGIKKLVLPASVTEAVAQRMRAERARLAGVARDEGEAESQRLRSEAEAQSRVITSFAQLRASDVENQGRQRAAQIMASFSQDQEFAIYLDQLETLERTLRAQTRFIIDTSKPPFSLLRGLTPGSLQPVDPSGSDSPPAPQADSRDAAERTAGND